MIKTTLRERCGPPLFSRRNLYYIYVPSLHILRITKWTNLIMDALYLRRNYIVSMNFHGAFRKEMRRYYYCHMSIFYFSFLILLDFICHVI